MAKIVFCWELGRGYGHIMGFLPYAKKLRDNGYEVEFIIRDLFYARDLLEKQGFPISQAPLWLHSQRDLPPTVSYTEILFQFGYLDPEKLSPLVSSWRRLFELLKPDLLIFDHSPTALLAAKGLDVRKATFGTGFLLPPDVSPLPSICSWMNVPERRLHEADHVALSTVNTILRNMGNTELNQLSELFEADEHFLMTLPELDHYGQRKGATYWGPRFDRYQGIEPIWPDFEGKKIFGYIKPGFREFDTLIMQLSTLPYSFILHTPAISVEKEKRLQARNIKMVVEPVKLKLAAEQCDAAICHAGHGTVAAFLIEGKPLIMLPTQLEQSIMTGRAVKLGVALDAGEMKESPDYAKTVTELMTNTVYRKNARKFAKKYDKYDEALQMEKVLERMKEILS
ncbi:MAG: hypothetical protein OEX83_00460 [Gammaproteobacteria bacterium]|nr:hypothetical protein [Gammaproteobacteria bacterium]